MKKKIFYYMEKEKNSFLFILCYHSHFYIYKWLSFFLFEYVSIRPRSRNQVSCKHSYPRFCCCCCCSMLVIFFVRNTSILIISVISHNRSCPIKFSVYVLNENPLIVWSLRESCEANVSVRCLTMPTSSTYVKKMKRREERERARKNKYDSNFSCQSTFSAWGSFNGNMIKGQWNVK